ncbi:hypothetical protein [Pedobacter chinensis]|nr:hypothetical protein [Pedobacter chinensis]
METRFTISLSLQVPNGKLPYGRFMLGTEMKVAQEIFAMLKGKNEPIQGCCIQLELLEEIAALPVPIGVLNCCLEDLKENIAIISKEIFRISNLEDDGFKTLK